ncbi:MAG: CDGSH iron-sulfur domain-containing protein [Actinomycetes bacterium]|jgi:CDGSH-type Zn-finger protein|nr:CDGSH iron-sulfur domain-containing protein [Actinomycetes bacterium]
MIDKSKIEMRIDVTPNGPYAVTGGVPLSNVRIVRDENKAAVGWETVYEFPAMETYVLCRCGGSKFKPFCDSTHCLEHFDGTEVDSRAEYMDGAQVYSGEGIDLLDNERFCVHAGFCDRGKNAWEYTADSADADSRATALEEAALCPSGRLVMFLKESCSENEIAYPPSIALIEDPVYNVSGPIWVRGGIPIYGADGVLYEKRNRVALCRCGKSANKPYCDGTHYDVGFNDGHI